MEVVPLKHMEVEDARDCCLVQVDVTVVVVVELIGSGRVDGYHAHMVRAGLVHMNENHEEAQDTVATGCMSRLSMKTLLDELD